MEQSQYIFGAEHLPLHPAVGAKGPEKCTARETARLIAGKQHETLYPKTTRQSVGVAGNAATLSHSDAPRRSAQVSTFAKSVSPAMLGAVLPDVLIIGVSFFALTTLIADGLKWPTLLFYVVAYLSCAARAEVYEHGFSLRPGAQTGLAVTLLSATLFTILALECSPGGAHLTSLLLWSGLNLFLLSTFRRVKQSTLEGRAGTINVMVVGDPFLGQEIFDSVRRNLQSGRVVREFILDRCLGEAYGSALMSRVARQSCIDEVIIVSRDPAIRQAAIREAKRNQLDVFVVPDLSGSAALGFEFLEGTPLVKVSEQKFPEWALAGKRVADFLLSFAGLISLSPLMMLIALLIKLDSRGPALYRALRVGRKGRRFRCYKFRTMLEHADAMKVGLRSRNQRNGAFFKISDDPRITRVGRFLRRYSLDELPQLWNVLVGDMSLVGPRPHPPDDVERYNLGDLRRLDFVPGITGLWQVTARQDPSFERCVDLDVEYIEKWSLSLDLKILWLTVATVLQGSGT